MKNSDLIKFLLQLPGDALAEITEDHKLSIGHAESPDAQTRHYYAGLITLPVIGRTFS